MELLWWHWVVLGVTLTLLELAVPAFVLVWFGVGAIIVGLAVLIFPQMPFAWQGVIWAAFSIAFIWLWFKVFKPGMHKTRVSYQTSGITWWADYNVTYADGAAANACRLDIGAWSAF